MEVTTEVPQTGTKLRIDADRTFEGASGDSVLRVQGERQDGGQVFDATYIEADAQEAQVVANVLRALTQPPQRLLDAISQEVQATFASVLSGRDANQIAQIVSRSWARAIAYPLGDDAERDQRINHLAERFDRASAQRRNAPASVGGNGQSKSGKNS